MTRKATTTSTATGADGPLTGADRAQQRHLNWQLEAKAQRMSDEAEGIADGMRVGILEQMLRFLSGKW